MPLLLGTEVAQTVYGAQQKHIKYHITAYTITSHNYNKTSLNTGKGGISTVF